MKRIYVASRYSAHSAAARAAYARKARHLCYLAMGDPDVIAAFAPHGFYTEFLDDEDLVEREMGLAAGHAFLEKCDEVWVYSRDGISGGMREEIELAEQLKIPVVKDPPCWEGFDA